MIVLHQTCHTVDVEIIVLTIFHEFKFGGDKPSWVKVAQLLLLILRVYKFSWVENFLGCCLPTNIVPMNLCI